MTTKELYDLKHQLHDLCNKVGAYQMANLGRRDLVIDAKSTSVDLVTEVDKASEVQIIEFIHANYPSHSILAEESGQTDKESDYTWVIDPVDGTTNYAHGYPLFAISIGVQYLGETLLGCIYMPALDEFYWAIKGEGAFVNNKEISVSQVPELANAIVASGFPYNKRETSHNNIDYFSHICPLLGGVRRSGSACVDLVSVAGGRIDGYFEMYLNPWDFVAGQLIVREAGGYCEVRYVRDKYSIVCTNTLLTDELRHEIEKIGREDY